MIRKLATAAAALALFAPAFARASTATGNMTVTASVAAKCTLTVASNVAFGAYDPIVAAPANEVTQGSLVVSCTKNTSFDVSIAGARSMANGADALPFELYSNAARTTVWPAAVGSGVTGTGKQTLTVYGVVNPAGTALDIGTGNYTATVPVTVNY